MHKVVQGWAGLCWDGSMTHRVATSAPPPPIPDQVCVWGGGLCGNSNPVNCFQMVAAAV